MTVKKRKTKPDSLVPYERIENLVLIIRGHKVIIDRDLADLYKVSTKQLNQQIKRNIKRFPEDFMFQLTEMEADALRSQIVTSKGGRGGRRYLPYVFTEQGVAMLSSVLNSERAIQVNIQIMRAFTKLRELMLTHKDLARKLEKMERDFSKKFDDHDHNFTLIFKAIRKLLEEPEKKKKSPIGFQVPK